MEINYIKWLQDNLCLLCLKWTRGFEQHTEAVCSHHRSQLSLEMGRGIWEHLPANHSVFKGQREVKVWGFFPPCHKVIVTRCCSKPPLMRKVCACWQGDALPRWTLEMRQRWRYLWKFAGRKTSASVSVFHHRHNCLNIELHSCMQWQSPPGSECGSSWGRPTQRASFIFKAAPSCSPKGHLTAQRLKVSWSLQRCFEPHLSLTQSCDFS